MVDWRGEVSGQADDVQLVDATNACSGAVYMF